MCAVSPFLFVLLLVALLLILLPQLFHLLVTLICQGTTRIDCELLDLLQFLYNSCLTYALHFFITIW